MGTPTSANKFSDAGNSRWRTCVWCGSNAKTGVVYFDSGSVAPTVGETITGATSGDTAVIDKVGLLSGTYAGGDAAGYMELSSPTGYDQDTFEIFSDNEELNGSTSGNSFSTVDHVGSVTSNGTLYPEGDLIEENGKLYCKFHFKWRFNNEWKKEFIYESHEGDRRS